MADTKSTDLLNYTPKLDVKAAQAKKNDNPKQDLDISDAIKPKKVTLKKKPEKLLNTKKTPKKVEKKVGPEKKPKSEGMKDDTKLLLGMGTNLLGAGLSGMESSSEKKGNKADAKTKAEDAKYKKKKNKDRKAGSAFIRAKLMGFTNRRKPLLRALLEKRG